MTKHRMHTDPELDAWIEKIRMLRNEGDREAELTALSEFEAMLTPVTDHTGHYRRQARLFRAYILKTNAQLEQALEVSQTLLSESETCDDEFMAAQARALTGSILFETGSAASAISMLEQCAAILISYDDAQASTNALVGIGAARVRLADYDGAIRAFTQGLELNQRAGRRHAQAILYQRIAAPYYYMGDMVQALEYSLTSYRIAKEIGFESEAASAADNISVIAMEVGAYDIARRWIRTALQYYDHEVRVSPHVNSQLNKVAIEYRAAPSPATLAPLLNAAEQHKNTRFFEESIKAALEAVHGFLSMGDHQTCLRFIEEWLPYAVEKQMLQDVFSMQVARLICRVHLEPSPELWDECCSLLESAREQKMGDDEERLMEIAAIIQERILQDPTEALARTREYHELRQGRASKRSHNIIAMVDAQHRHDQAMALGERQRELLESVMPDEVVQRLMNGEENIADSFDNASVMFLDLVSFTDLSSNVPPAHLIHLLNAVFSTCDDVVNTHGLTKIKTIGDSYLAVSGLPHPQDDHAQRIANAALDLMTRLKDLQVTMPPELGDTSWVDDVGDLSIRIGLHCGPVVAGVIGRHRAQYDVWGDTVNTASRMESNGQPDRIHISEDFALKIADGVAPEIDGTDIVIKKAPYHMRLRGTMPIKGKGELKTFWLEAQ